MGAGCVSLRLAVRGLTRIGTDNVLNAVLERFVYRDYDARVLSECQAVALSPLPDLGLPQDIPRSASLFPTSTAGGSLRGSSEILKRSLQGDGPTGTRRTKLQKKPARACRGNYVR